MSDMEVRNYNVTSILERMPLDKFIALEKSIPVVENDTKDTFPEVYLDANKKLEEVGLSMLVEYKGTGVDDKCGWRFFVWDATVFLNNYLIIAIPFRMGIAHHVSQYHESHEIKKISPIAPSLAEVIHSLTVDFVEKGVKFEEWCRDLGFSDDSLTYYRMFKECKRISKTLRRTKFPVEKCREILEDF